MKHAMRKSLSHSVSLFTQSENNALEASGPIIEDITELCDFCLRLTELIVEPKDSRQHGEQDFQRCSGQESCRLCEMISSVCSTAPSQLKNEFKGCMRAKQKHERFRLCDINFGAHSFPLWDNEGKKPIVLHRWTTFKS